MTSPDLYAYDLPPQQIAQEPSRRRDGSRAIFVERGCPGGSEAEFRELPERLRGDECLIVNDTQVIPARIRCRRASGARIEVFLLRPEDGETWRAWVSPSRRVHAAEELTSGAGSVVLIERVGSFWRVRAGRGELLRQGEVPLPPYIHRSDGDPRLASLDRERYQTVFARRPGAVAAPTAGLHFTQEVLEGLARRGIPVIRVTLHVGPGTFKPITAARIEEHRVDPELFEISTEARSELAACRRERRRIVCVGTTTLRLLEGLEDLDGGPAITGETSLTLGPGHRFRHADGLITNFHLPRSSLLVLVAAFHGLENTLETYRRALRAGFRFYSYGDSMVILPPRTRC